MDAGTPFRRPTSRLREGHVDISILDKSGDTSVSKTLSLLIDSRIQICRNHNVKPRRIGA
jgi:hypothetical protein